jgi:hypothetical protein
MLKWINVGRKDMDELIKKILETPRIELRMDELEARALQQVLIKTTSLKRQFKPSMTSMLPPIGWFINFVTEKPNDTPEGLGTIKQPHRVAVVNPRSTIPWTQKEADKFAASAAVRHELYKSQLASKDAADNDQFTKAVDSFLAKEQLQGKFKF